MRVFRRLAQPPHRTYPLPTSLSRQADYANLKKGLRLMAAFSDVSSQRGFLPDPDPLQRLPSQYRTWEDALDELPKRIVAADGSSLKQWLRGLPEFPLEHLHQHYPQQEVLWRAYLVFSFLAHGYLWGEPGTPDRLPACLAVPWCALSRQLDMPPVLVYSTYNLYNWRRLDASKPIELGNIVCLHNFFGGVDEEWFRLIHVAIEARAAASISSIPAVQDAASQGDADAVEHFLESLSDTLRALQGILARMGEKCRPDIYYHRVRLPMSGWRDNPALPNGLIYEGVSAKYVQLHGETGAQSSIIACLDAVLGIKHAQGWLADYLKVMRAHMPPAHRRFTASIEARPALRTFVQAHARLVPLYNSCVDELLSFREQHKSFAYTYIAQHSKAQEKGTGGTDFMPALRGYAQTTSQHSLPA